MGFAAQLYRQQRRQVRGNAPIRPPKAKPAFENKPGTALKWLLKDKFGSTTAGCSNCFAEASKGMDKAGVIGTLGDLMGYAGILRDSAQLRPEQNKRLLAHINTSDFRLNFQRSEALIREACDLASFGTDIKRHPSLAQPATFVWLFVQSASDSSPKGEELRYSMRSVKANYNGEASFMLIGDIPDWYHGPAIPRQRKRFNNRPKYRDTVDAIRLACESDLIPDEWVWMDDDTYFTGVVTLDDLRVTRYQGVYPMMPTGGFPHADVKGDTFGILRSEGVAAMDTATHLPQVFDSGKWLAMAEKYDLRNRALLHEMLYASEYGAEGARPYEAEWFRRITVSGDANLLSHISNNSVSGWSINLHSALRAKFPTPTLHESFKIHSRGKTLDLLDGETTAVQRIVRKEGFETYEPETVRALQAAWESLPEGFTFLDVGANCGLYACLCKLQRPDARVIAFEPAPETMAIGKRISEANGLDVKWEELAISDKCGEATLYLSAKSDASNSLVSGFRKARGTVTVKTETLDCYCEKHGIKPDAIKLDVELLEPQALAGGRRMIETHRPMIVAELQRGDDVSALTDELPDFYGQRFLEAIHTRENHLFAPEPV